MANIQDSTTRKMEKTKHPGIYRRGSRYVVVYRDPQGRQRKKFAETLRQALDAKAMLRADVRRGEYRTLSRVGFADYARDWIETYQGRTSRGVGEGSRDDYRDALERNAIPFFGNARLPEIEPRDLKKFAARLQARGLKPGSVKKLMAPVKCLLADAVEEGLIRSNPAAGMRIAQPNDESLDEVEKVKALSEDDLRRLLKQLPEAWRFFFDFLSQTGLRIGEAIELRHSDVEGNWLRVSRRYYRGRVGLPKGRKSRRVPMSRELARQLWALRKEGAVSDDLVFTSAKGQRIDPSNVMSRVLKPAAIEADLGEWVGEGAHLRADTWVGFHTFRHTCATRLFRSGWNAVQVKDFLGHSDPGFTLRTYVHLLPEDLPEPAFPRASETGREDYFTTRKGDLIELEEVGGNEGATEGTETDRNAPTAPDEVPPTEQEESSARFGTAGR